MTALESALRELQPRAQAMDRALLMYRAGRASAYSCLWPLATMATTTLAAVFAVFLLIRPAPPVVERIVYVPAPAVEPQSSVVEQPEITLPTGMEPLVMEPAASGPRARYVQMEESVLRWGLKGIPPPPPAPPLPDTPTIEQLLQSL
ncbi:MAG TPA: hypothetical protein VH592_08005 [Gemmataceae bacterium]